MRRRNLVGAIKAVSCLLIALGLWGLGQLPAFGQPDNEAGDAAPADPAADNAAPAGDAAPGENPPREPQTQLEFYFGALGWRYTIAFLFISFTGVALLVMNILAARREAVIPAALVDEFEAMVNEKRYQEAYDRAKSDDSFLGRVLAAGLAKLSKGYPQAIEAMQEVGEEENMRIEHRLSYIAMIGTISPMVGLLGTVDGMVISFQEIAIRTTTPPPYVLAQGISMALITTLVGLVIAIPAIALFGILRNRFSRLVLEVGIVSEELMSRVHDAAARKPA